MRLTVTMINDHIFTLDVGEDMELENFKALCEFESGIPSKQIAVIFEGTTLMDDKRDLKSYNIKDGDVILIKKIEFGESSSTPALVPSDPLMAFDFGSIRVPNSDGNGLTSNDHNSPAYIRDMLLSNPEQIAILRINNPRLTEALETSLEEFTKVLREQQNHRAEEERRRIRMLVADPFDAEAQRMIAEEIQRQQIDSNMETAMEYHPESFGQVTMLYIHCLVNEFPIKAFIDSGAQSTIMSKSCAERCNIMRLADTRWSGIAKGVGTQRIYGRIHLVQIQIGNDYLATSFTILEDQSMDVLIGLDMLKRHQCSIDLKRNVLLIGTTGAEAPFLNESELPEFAKHRSTGHGNDDSQLAEAINRSVKEICSTSPPSSSSSNTGAHPFKESDILEIQSLGYTREQSIDELRKFNGDKNQAMASLLAKALRFPK